MAPAHLKEPRYRSPTAQLCTWHKNGKPPSAPPRFYSPGCLKCEEKRKAGLVSPEDPTPKSHYLQYAKRLQYGKNAEQHKEKSEWVSSKS